ncbi:hypothetical protein [Helicobacter bizzozeronii]|uniref:hypothetical protein n=1 Tax=Helicobacter bizzozeronii TaxID=56877 RepID=UPI000CF0D3F8|nr:hypothetical protein [Helicobacter bizzozeronii]
MKKILCFLVCFLASLHAMDDRKAMEQVKQWVRDFVPKEMSQDANNYYVISPQAEWSVENKVPIEFKGEKYTFLYAKAKFYTNNEATNNAWMCSGVLYQGKLYKGFCLEGFNGALFAQVVEHNQEPYLVLVLGGGLVYYGQPTLPILVFKIIDRTFYLDYYGAQSAYARIDRYCLSQDDPEGAHKIAMGELNNNILNQLKMQVKDRLCGLKNPPQQLPVDVMMGKRSYTLFQIAPYFYLDNTPLAGCDYIRPQGLGYWALCHSAGAQTKFTHKGRFLTLESYWQNKPTSKPFIKAYKGFITLKEIDGALYLYQYSQQVFQVETKSAFKELLGTDIFYRQPRDDPNAKNLLPLDKLSIYKLSKLETECRFRGLCEPR